MVLVLPEVQQLLLCGSLKTIADHTQILIMKDTTDYTQMFIGATIALMTAGLLHDLLFKQSTYMLIITMNLL